LVRILTATLSLQLIWVFASAFVGMRLIRRNIGHKGAAYVLAMNFFMLFIGAAGMLHFEGSVNDPQGILSYARALWWTAMQLSNMGSGYVIKTTGGRVINLCVSIYAVVIFGYISALLASFLIDPKLQEPKPANASEKSLQAIHEEIIRLRRLIEEDLQSGSLSEIKSKMPINSIPP
jgi:voltage-gated potassium channel